MTRNEIVGKLESALSVPIKRESDVVYVLVGVRKLLEQESGGAEYDTLKFYCDWAVHCRLDRKGAKLFVGKINEYLERILKDGLTQEELKELEKLLYLESLRQELREFLQAQGLPGFICENGQWSDFLGLYSRIVQDCPLVCEVQGGPPRQVDKVMLTKQELSSAANQPSPDDVLPFTMRWELFRNRQSIGYLDLGRNGLLVGSEFVLASRKLGSNLDP